MNEDQIVEQTEQKPNDSTPEASKGEGSERLFTQAELNQIIQERLARVKSGVDPEREEELNRREAELVGREEAMSRLEADFVAEKNRYECVQFCKEHKFTDSFTRAVMEELGTEDPKEFGRKAFALWRASRPVAPMASTEVSQFHDDLGSAFSRDQKHAPKNYYE